jgi:hypothetical protein
MKAKGFPFFREKQSLGGYTHQLENGVPMQKK